MAIRRAVRCGPRSSAEVDRSLGGLGIGLTLTRSLVELHGGTISAKSAGVGRGSEFVVTLPLADEHVVTYSGSSQRTAPAQRRGLRVLVVDDNKDSAIGLARILTHWGYEVKLAYDGLSAIELALTDVPPLILLDIGLPGINGYEVASQLRKDDRLKSSILIAISGYAQEEDRRRSREAGFDHHLVKPIIYDSRSEILAEHFPAVSTDQQNET